MITGVYRIENAKGIARFPRQDFDAVTAPFHLSFHPEPLFFVCRNAQIAPVKFDLVAVNLSNRAPIAVQQFGSTGRQSREKCGKFAAMGCFESEIHELMGNIERGTSGNGSRSVARRAAFGNRVRIPHRVKGYSKSQNKKLNAPTVVGNLKVSQRRLQNVTRMGYLSSRTVAMVSLRLRPAPRFAGCDETKGRAAQNGNISHTVA